MFLKSKVIKRTSVAFIFLIILKVSLVKCLFDVENNNNNCPIKLTVLIFEETNYSDNNEEYNSLKLNISWLPPLSTNTLWTPTSYSITVNSLLDDTNLNNCPDENIFLTVWDKNKFNVILPNSEILSDAPELIVRPKCSYEIQVTANPRANLHSNYAKINITIPECVGKSCSCDKASLFLPPPKIISSILTSNGIITIKWINPDGFINSTAVSYLISYGVPILISKNGLTVYNISRIENVATNTSTYLWTVESNSLMTLEKSKIFISAQDIHGCRGNASEFRIYSSSEIEALQTIKETTWTIWICILSICLVFIGIIVYLVNRGHVKYKFMLSTYTASMSQIPRTNHWINSILKKHNILYPQLENIPASRRNETVTDKFELNYNRLNITTELGKGQFGKVYLGYLDDEEFPIAVKMSNSLESIDEVESRNQLLREIETMKRVGPHPHLVELIGYSISPNNSVYIILEYVSHGDLLKYLHQLRETISPDEFNPSLSDQNLSRFTRSEMNVSDVSSSSYYFPATTSPSTNHSISSKDYNNPTYISVKYKINDKLDKRLDHATSGEIDKHKFIQFASDIAKGMEHLHKYGIIHRDLAARNILVTSNLNLKISDFGLSRDDIYVIDKNGSKEVRRLPVRWMAPETLCDRIYTLKSDVWSYSIVLWEIGTLGEFPYKHIQDDELQQYIILNKGRLNQPKYTTKQLYQLMCLCWSYHPQMRPNFKQILINLKSISNQIDINNPCYMIL